MSIALAPQSTRLTIPNLPIRAAWHTALKRRAIVIMIAMWLVMSVGFGVAMAYAIYRSILGDPSMAAYADDYRSSFLLSNFNAFTAGSLPFWGAATALALGVLVVGSEYAGRTVNLVYTHGPRRVAVLASQLIALAGLLALVVLVSSLVNVGGLLVVAGIENLPVAAPPLGATLVSLGGEWLTTLAYGFVGAALSILMRSQISALGIGLGWTLGIETVLVKVCATLGWTTAGSMTLAGATSNLAVARGSYPWWPNGLVNEATVAQGWLAATVLAIWALAAIALAVALIGRRDI
jgi:ABC-type transport system involved in multi-copper enzyme maturation permease subunit